MKTDGGIKVFLNLLIILTSGSGFATASIPIFIYLFITHDFNIKRRMKSVVK